MSLDWGAAARTAAMRAASPPCSLSPPSLTLSSVRLAALAALAAIAAGAPSEIVKAVVSGCGAGKACEFMHRAAAALGFQVPEGAVERVAGGPRRHRVLQGAAVEPGSELPPHRRKRGGHAIDAFAIARIGHAFAAAAVAAVAEFGDHDDGLRLDAAANGEGAGDRPAFGGYGKGQGGWQGVGGIHGNGLSAKPSTGSPPWVKYGAGAGPRGTRGRAVKSEACQDERPLARSQCQRRSAPARRRRRLDRHQRAQAGKPDRRRRPAGATPSSASISTWRASTSSIPSAPGCWSG